MCWCTENAACGKMKVAKDDIKTFKIVLSWPSKNQLLSYFTNFKYTIGEAYKTEIGALYTVECSDRNLICIHEGFHSYSDYNGRVTIEKSGSNYRFLIIEYNNKVSDSYQLPNSRLDLYKKMNCIIPKGAKYYLNEEGIYVSNKIKVVSWEELPQVTNE